MNDPYVAEAERRGLIRRPQQQPQATVPVDPYLTEAQRRGLIGGGQKRAASAMPPQQQNQMPGPVQYGEGSATVPLKAPLPEKFSIGNTVSSGLSAFNDTLAGMPGDVMDASSYIARNTIAPAIDAVAGTNYAQQIGSSQSVGQGMRDDVAKLIPRTAPESTAARLAASGGRAAAQSIPVMGIGKALSAVPGTIGAIGSILTPQNGNQLAQYLSGAFGAGVGADVGRDAGQEVGGNTGAAIGEVVGAFGGGMAGGMLADRLRSASAPRAKAPSISEVRAMADAAYKSADDAGVVFTPKILDRIDAQIKPFMTERGMTPELEPRAFSALRAIATHAQENQTLKGMDVLRQIARSASEGVSATPKEKAFAGKLVAIIDDALENPAAGEVLMGDAGAGSAALKEARRLWAVKSKAEWVDQLIEKGKHEASVSGSGGNENNRIRANIGKIVDPTKPWNARGFTPAEIEQAKRASYGTGSANALRTLGQMGPQGNGLGGMLHMGMAAGTGGWSAIASALLAGAKSRGSAMTRNEASRLSEMIRMAAARPNTAASSSSALANALRSAVAAQTSQEAGRLTETARRPSR